MPIQHSYKISGRKLVAFIIMVFSFMGGYSIFTGPAGSVQWNIFYYGRFFLVIFYSVYSYNKRTTKRERRLIKWINKYSIALLTSMIMYSALLWIIHSTNIRYISRGLSDFIFLLGACVSGTYMAKILGKDTLKYGLLAAMITMAISSVIGIISMGGDFFTTLIKGDNRYVELHEALFVIGLYLVFHMFSSKLYYIRKDKILFALGMLTFIVGGKRIGFAAVLLVLIYVLLVNKKGERRISLIVKISGWIIAAVSIVYIWISVTGVLDLLLIKFSIDMYNRNIIYNYFRSFCEYGPQFLGNGMGFVGRQFEYATRDDLYNMISIRALHNDFFKQYIEIGFWGSIVWVFYWIKYFPKKIENKVGTKAMLICFCLLMYSFITFTTDNTAGYFNYQLHLFMLFTVAITAGDNALGAQINDILKR